MGLFESNEGSDDFLWVAEALAQGVISHGQMLTVASIVKTSSGNGYILRCELDDGSDVYDFAYKKSKPGKTLSAMFDDPEVADGWQIQVKAQDKKRCAVCDSVATEGLVWQLGATEAENECLTPVLKKTASTGKGKSAQNS